MRRYTVMSPFTGQCEDIHISRPRGDGYHLLTVRLGRSLIGQIGRHSHGWTAISNASTETLKGLRLVEGLRTQWACVEYLLRAGGIRDERRDLAWDMEAATEPVMTVLSADAIAPGQAVTLCTVPGTDLFLARAHMPHDPVARPAPADVETLGWDHQLREIGRRADERKAKESL